MTFASRRVPADGGSRVEVRGEVDTASAAEFRTALLTAIDSGTPVAVDLGGVTFMDSAGFGVLAEANRQAQVAGTPMRLQRVPPRIGRLLALLGLDAVLTIDAGPPAGTAPR